MHADYDSISPYKLGGHNVRFRVVSAPERCPVYQLLKQSQDLSNFLRVAPHQQLSIDHTPACYASQVQRQGPGKYMPIEGTSVEQKGPDAPFATIADIIVPAQDFDSQEQNLFYDNLSFNPWHALPGHRSINGVNRLWKAVCETISGCRLGKNG